MKPATASMWSMLLLSGNRHDDTIRQQLRRSVDARYRGPTEKYARHGSAWGCFVSGHRRRAGDVVVMSEFASAQTGEIGLRAIGAGAADAEAVLVIDPLHDEAGMQRVPRRALVGMNRGAYSDPLADRRHGIRLGRKHLRQRAAAALAHRHHHLTLARLVLGEAPVDPVDR